MSDEQDIERTRAGIYGEGDPDSYFDMRRRSETNGWYTELGQKASLAQWDRMMAAHDAAVRADTLEEAAAWCDAEFEVSGVAEYIGIELRARAASIREGNTP